MAEDEPTLTVDRYLYFVATELLGDLEGGEESFAIDAAANTFACSPAVREHFDHVVGQELKREHDTITKFIMGVGSPHHHNLYLEGAKGDLDTYQPAVSDFIASAAWTFLTVWTQRYGGLNMRLVTHYGSVDPTGGQTD